MPEAGRLVQPPALSKCTNWTINLLFDPWQGKVRRVCPFPSVSRRRSQKCANDSSVLKATNRAGAQAISPRSSRLLLHRGKHWAIVKKSTQSLPLQQHAWKQHRVRPGPHPCLSCPTCPGSRTWEHTVAAVASRHLPTPSDGGHAASGLTGLSL